MFASASNGIDISWAAPGQGKADYIEALHYEDDKFISSHNFRIGHLKGAQVEQWLQQSGNYAVPQAFHSGKKLIGGLRLLICERQQYSPLDFPIESQTFETLLKTFNLPASTLAVSDSDAGSYFRHLVFEDAAKTKLKRVGVVMKAPQKREISNHGLALSHDIATNFTTALLYGTDVPCFQTASPEAVVTAGDYRKSATAREAHIDAMKNATARHFLGPAPDPFGQQYIVSPTAVGEGSKDDGEHAFVKLIKEAKDGWHHPMMLPCILLADHMRRTKDFCNRGRIMHETWAIEGELGVTYVGRRVDEVRFPLYAPVDSSTTTPKPAEPLRFHHENRQLSSQSTPQVPSIGRGKAEELTVRINTQSLRILFTARSPKWNRDCSAAMRHLLDELDVFLATTPHFDAAVNDSLKELLDYNVTMAESVGSHVEGMRQRMALQLNVLYSMVAQMDNRLSARLAASAGRDSTSMKILAFITAIYLPGSFVSGMFSMGMFQWPFGNNSSISGSNGQGNKVLSPDFWVYWATTLPLTALTLIGWGIWWVFEMKQFKKSYAEALGDQKDPVDKVLQLSRSRSRKRTDDTEG